MKNRRKLSFIIGIAFLIIIGILFIDRHWEASSINEKIGQYQKNQMGYVVQVAQKVEMTFSRLFGHLYLLSQATQVQVMEKNSCLLNLVRTYELNKELISGVYRYDIDNTLRYGYPLGDCPISAEELKPLFEEGRMTGKQLARVIRKRRDGSDFLVIAQPVFAVQGKVHFTPSNKYVGTLIFISTLDKFQAQLFPQLVFGERGYPWIISEESLVLVTGNDVHRGKTFAEFLPQEMIGTDQGIDPIMRKMINGESGNGLYRYHMHNNVEEDMVKLTSYVPIHLPEQRWSVAVSTPLQDVTASLSKRSLEHRLVTFVSLLVVVFMTALLVSSVHRGYRQSLHYLQRREEEDRKIKLQWQQTFDAIDNMIFLLDDKLRIIRTNKAVMTGLGRNLPEVSGQVITDLLWNGADGDRSGPFRLAQTTRSRQTARLESVKLSRIMLMTIAPVEEIIDSQAAFICSIKDITELEEMQNRLNNVRKMEALATLAGGVAHDLNNILSGVVSYPDLLLHSLAVDHPMRKPLITIQKSGQRAVAVVRDLMLLARRGVYEKNVINLNTIIEEICTGNEFEHLKQLHPEVDVQRQLAPDLLNIKGSALHLATLVMNITKNSIEAISGAGQIVISTKNVFFTAPPIEFPAVQPGAYVQLAIRDTGTGITPKDLEHIFEPFYSKKILGRSGTGLGMAVVWGTVQDHSGGIAIASEPDKGTTVSVVLPATGDPLTVTLEVGDATQLTMGSGQSILIVDDQEEQRQIALMMCETLNYRPHVVCSGEEALTWLENQSADLVMLDMIMGSGMDGLQTFKQIRKRLPLQKTMIVSGHALEERIQEALSAGICSYLKKPYSIGQFAGVLAEILK
ncbi:MAG: response regulator [Proteobacteria bacterium]|nr:response regulator [Pseudomonadota bacterium]